MYDPHHVRLKMYAVKFIGLNEIKKKSLHSYLKTYKIVGLY